MQDRSFTFILKTPPASVLLQKAAGIQKGSGTPNSNKVGKVTRAQLRVSRPTICSHSLSDIAGPVLMIHGIQLAMASRAPSLSAL